MRSLRARLFAAILGVVLLGVGASLALGIVLTRDAVRETIRGDVERQADALAAHGPLLRAARARSERAASERAPGAAGLATPTPLAPPLIGGPPPGAEGPAAQRREGENGGLVNPPRRAPEPRPVAVVSLREAAEILPSAAVARLRRDGSADGTAQIEGRDSIFAARRSGRTVVLVTRPDLVSGDDFRRYLSALLIASGAAALLAAAAAGLLARRLTQPLRRLAAAAGELAAGRHPEPVPPEGTEELDDLAGAFNGMSEQLALARDAERAVLLSVSHDLRTPLTSIRGYAEGVEDGTVDAATAAAVIGREAERLERLVGDLLALARLRQGVVEVRHEPVDLAAVAREAEERLRPHAGEAGVDVQVDGDAMVTADHGRTLQVVSNLLENAVRVSPPGGTVTVGVASGEVQVSDQGPGIPEEEIPRAFERFRLRARRADSEEGSDLASPEGAGLGLAIVRELTEAMGGTVSVENLPSGGARFTVRLPLPD